MRGPDRTMIRIARRLRVNQTDAEKALWNRIRSRQIDGYKFVRQEPIGSYVCDFVCRERHLIVEVDGGQHSDSAADGIRDRRLAEDGYRVLRFWNNDVLEISKAFWPPFRPNSPDRAPHPDPLPAKGGEREKRRAPE